ncbi:MAG: phage head closure protein, partial [bacterium]
MEDSVVRARRLRSRITIQTPTRTANSYGEPIETFSTYAIRWAEIKMVTGRE